MEDRDFLQEMREILQPLCAIGHGGSWELMKELLYDIRLFRYITQEQAKRINPRYEKIFSKKKIAQLVQLGMIAGDENGCRATEKTTRLLKAWGCQTILLQPEPKGNAGLDSILKTDVFIKARSLTHYLALLFPRFPKEEPYLIPDALLVEARSESEYKLTFLEIETDKFYHDDYLNNKRLNYLRLAEDDQVYRYWVNIAEHLKLKKPTKEQFCFSVKCITNLKLEFKGWSFEKTIS